MLSKPIGFVVQQVGAKHSVDHFSVFPANPEPNASPLQVVSELPTCPPAL